MIKLSNNFSVYDTEVNKAIDSFVETLENTDSPNIIKSKFQEVVNAMTTATFSRVNDIDKQLKSTLDKDLLTELQNNRQKLLDNLQKSIREIALLGDKYLSRDKNG